MTSFTLVRLILDRDLYCVGSPVPQLYQQKECQGRHLYVLRQYKLVLEVKILISLHPSKPFRTSPPYVIIRSQTFKIFFSQPVTDFLGGVYWGEVFLDYFFFGWRSLYLGEYKVRFSKLFGLPNFYQTTIFAVTFR